MKFFMAIRFLSYNNLESIHPLAFQAMHQLFALVLNMNLLTDLMFLSELKSLHSL